MTRVIAVLLALAVSTPALAQSKPAPLADIRTAAGTVLKDAQSAQFERVQSATKPNGRGEPTEVACGWVNAKNGFGAYVGLRPFVFLVSAKRIYIAGGNDSDAMLADILIKRFCA